MNTSIQRARERGFTLIEIMIVIAIITAVLAIGAPRLVNNSTQMRATIRQLAVMTREIRNNARLYNVTSRLVLDIDGEKSPAFWVESSPGNVLLLTEAQRKDLEKLTSAQRQDEEKKSSFDLDARVTHNHIRLPRGLKFESVEYASRNKALAVGKAYVHFFPQGLTEEAVIHLTDGKTLNWTIAINPLNGHAEVYERKVMLKELHR